MKTLAAVTTLALAAAAQQAGRPHIVVIVSDDAGYADFSMHGADDIATPRIDSIAANGVRFSNGYVSGPVCSPTRAGFMTGRYQQRFGHELNIPPRFSEENGLPVEERTIADHLDAVGYRTVAIGKWHLGYAEKFHPCSRGFDDYFGFLQGARPYFPLERPTQLNRLLRDREVQPEKFEYMTDELAARAVEYIADRGDEPVFLYLAFNAVHTPMHATEKDLEGVEGKPRRQKLVGMTRALDRAVGVVLDGLAAQGILDDTLLFFFNDNGGATNNASRNTPLRGRKGQVFEGGIRVPFLVQWPAKLAKGRVCDDPVIQLDVTATCLAVAGVAMPTERPLDGVDLMPTLLGQKEAPPHDALFWRQRTNWAIREGRWKLVHQGAAADPVMLFDLDADIGETRDLAVAQPERAVAMQARYAAWSAQMVEPLWGYGRNDSKK